MFLQTTRLTAKERKRIRVVAEFFWRVKWVNIGSKAASSNRVRHFSDYQAGE